MSLKKQQTQRKHKRIFCEIETLMNTDKVTSVWAACKVVSKKVKMTPLSVSVAYYTYRKYNQEQMQEGEVIFSQIP